MILTNKNKMGLREIIFKVTKRAYFPIYLLIIYIIK